MLVLLESVGNSFLAQVVQLMAIVVPYMSALDLRPVAAVVELSLAQEAARVDRGV